MFVDDIKICLASASPRRQELLRQIGVEFEVFIPEIKEAVMEGERPKDYALRIARDKARVAWQQRAVKGMLTLPILGADTCVVAEDGSILGKPRDHKHAQKILKKLAGSKHKVMTAIVLKMQEEEYNALSVSQVTLEKLSSAEIERYCLTGEPADKAGAYGIQGRAAAFISHIEGSYSGIMGLPLYELVQGFKHFGLAP